MRCPHCTITPATVRATACQTLRTVLPWKSYGRLVCAAALIDLRERQREASEKERLLDAERTESSADAALLQGLRTHSSSLDEATVAYLRRTYLQ